jgi:hypothetical protein
MCVSHDHEAVIVPAIQKRYNSHWAMSVAANGVIVGSENKKGKRIDADGVVPASLLHDKKYFKIYTGELWHSPAVMSSSNAITKIYETKKDEDVVLKIKELLGESYPIAAEVYICDELKDFVSFLFPSSRGHEGLVWLTNFEINKFKTLEQVCRRSLCMTIACTHYPFSSHNYSSVDEFAPCMYGLPLKLRWINSKKLEDKCSKEFELEIKALDDAISTGLIENHKTHALNLAPEVNKEQTLAALERLELMRKQNAALREHIQAVEDATKEAQTAAKGKFDDIDLTVTPQDLAKQTADIKASFKQ